MKTLEVTCKYCGEKFKFLIIKEDYISWMNGEGFIQDIMPYLSANLRELLISNTCGKCFDKMFENLPTEEDEG